MNVRRLALLLAFLWQGILIQAHVHVGRLSATAATRLAVVIDVPASHQDDPAACPLCRALAQAGRYLPGVPPLWSGPTPPKAWRPRLAVRRWRIRKRSHAWRSRGPPARAA